MYGRRYKLLNQSNSIVRRGIMAAGNNCSSPDFDFPIVNFGLDIHENFAPLPPQKMWWNLWFFKIVINNQILYSLHLKVYYSYLYNFLVSARLFHFVLLSNLGFFS